MKAKRLTTRSGMKYFIHESVIAGKKESFVSFDGSVMSFNLHYFSIAEAEAEYKAIISQ